MLEIFDQGITFLEVEHHVVLQNCEQMRAEVEVLVGYSGHRRSVYLLAAVALARRSLAFGHTIAHVS